MYTVCVLLPVSGLSKPEHTYSILGRYLQTMSVRSRRRARTRRHRIQLLPVAALVDERAQLAFLELQQLARLAELDLSDKRVSPRDGASARYQHLQYGQHRGPSEANPM